MKDFCLYLVVLICIVLLALLPGNSYLFLAIVIVFFVKYITNKNKKKHNFKWVKYIFRTVVIVYMIIWCVNAIDFFTLNCKSGVYEITNINKKNNTVYSFVAIDNTTKESISFYYCALTNSNCSLEKKKSYRIYYTSIFKDVVKIEEIETAQKLD